MHSIVKCIVVFLFVICLSTTIFTFLAGVRTNILFYCLPILTVFLIIYASFEDPSFKLLIPIALSIAPMIVLSSLSVHNFFPFGQDEGRFAGFAIRLLEDGHWQPGKYPIGEYYNWFPMVTGLKSLISMVTGLEILREVHTLLVLFSTFLFGFLMYVAVSKLFDSKRTGFMCILLVSFTPLFIGNGIIPQRFDYVFFSLFFALSSIYLFKNKMRQVSFIAMLLVSVAGIITHPTIVASVGGIILALYVSSLADGSSFNRSFKTLLGVFVVIVFAYWTHLYLLDKIIHPLRAGVSRVYSVLFAGQTYMGAASHHFTASASPLPAYAWAFFPASVVSFLTAEVISWKKAITSGRNKFVFLMALFSTLSVGYVFLDSLVGHPIGRYAYAACLVGLPVASLQLKRLTFPVEKKIFGTVVIALLAGVLAFSSVHEPTTSPDVNPQTVPNISSKPSDWHVARNLYHKVPSDYEVIGENVPGIGVPLNYYRSLFHENNRLNKYATIRPAKEQKKMKEQLIVYNSGIYLVTPSKER